MTQEAKLSATLPKTADANGLHSIAADMVRNPEGLHYAVVLLDTGKTEVRHQIDEWGERYDEAVPHARIRAIEPMASATASATAAQLMDGCRATRQGGGKVPLFGIGDAVSGDR